MKKRLVKVAKELNVGVATVVDYLNNNGFSIENKPTTVITDEMEQLLIKEFSGSIAVKEQADQLTIGIRPGLKKETEEKVKEKTTTTESPLFKKDLFKKPLFKKPGEAEESKPVEEPKEVQAPVVEKKEEEVVEEKPKVGLKVKGKIELDDKGMPIAPKKEEKEEPEVVEEAKEEKPAAEPVADEQEEPVETPETAEPGKAPQEPADEPVEGEDEDEEAEIADDDELVRMQAPELRGLKILGKIDIAKKEKKKKKTKKELEEEELAAKKKKLLKDKEGKKRPIASSDEEETRRGKRKRTRRKVQTDDVRPGSSSRGRRKPEREVSRKEVDEQIKKTMASLSGAGKKKRQKMRRETRERIREKSELRQMEGATDKLQVTEFITVQELANLMDVPVTDVITTCMNLGVIVGINQRLDAEIIELVAGEFGHEVEFISVEEQTDFEDDYEDDPKDLVPRAPIVTVMGHVDHGKTSLLDYIRNTNVAGGEAGGITQHIGAYEVVFNDKKLTFLDTPGHEAFTAMRARGAKVTDIAIIVIAADDNIMPQTKEAISHAQAAGVPMVFAINKIDKPGANPEKIKQELASMNILVEDWGGEYQSQDISAKTGQGIDALLEKVLLVAELADLKANPNRPAMGTILEASLDKGKGYVANILVQTGTLRIGDAMVAGEHSGKVKAMFNERGKRVKEAGPSTPVSMLGLSGAPQAGDRFKVMESETEARQIAAKRAQINRELANRATKRISLDEIGRRLALGTFKELNLIVKGDVDGSVEALSDALIKLSLETVQVNVIHRGVGQIIESDVLLASASDAIIIGFQVRPSLGARKLAEREGVQIKLYSIIYEAIEEVKLAIEGLLEPTKEEKIVANLEVRDVFKISKVGTVAGCYVMDGKLTRNTNIRVIRDGIVIYPTKEGVVGEISSLKRFKDDVKEVKNGMECGLTIKNFNDIKVGDVIEGYEVVEIKQTYD
ncbi:MAG: translation initiation factor IF-2 [Saprospirales bacterium]|nr:translation initiation factor IF-2 [Saprospirales bacterium]